MNARRDAAFTLVETVIALAIVLMLTGAMFAMLWNVTSRRDRLADAGRQRVGLSVLFDQLESDLAGCLAGGGPLPTGVVGTGTSLTILSRGTSIPVALDRSREDLSDLRLASYTLRGREIIAGRVAGVASGGPPMQPLIRGVRDVKFRYFNGSTWTDSFNSERSGLPVAVEVSVWLGEALPVEEAALQGELAREAVAETSVSAAEAQPGSGAGVVALAERLGPPDRSRIIVVPDAPTALETKPEAPQNDALRTQGGAT